MTYLKTLILIFLFGNLCTECFGQNNKYFEALRIQPLQNVDWKKDNSLAVKPFREILKNHNILTLAESTHIEGAVDDAQCLIMKELIISGDINTIYTESSCLNTDKITEILKKEGTKGIYDAQYYFGSGELSYWASNGFWDFLANKIIEGKVELVGIDIETTSDTLMKEMIAHAIKAKSAIAFFKKYPKESNKIMDDFIAVRQWYKTVEYTDSQYTVQSELIRAILSEYQEPEDKHRKK